MTDNNNTIAPDLLAQLGEGPELTTDQLRLLAILADPRNHAYVGWSDEPATVRETVLNLCTDDSFYGVYEISELLYAHYQHTQASNDPSDRARRQLSFALEATSDGEITSYSIGAYLGSELDSHLTFFRDPAHLGTGPGSYGRDSGGYYHFVEVDGQQQRVPGKPPEPSPLRKALAIAQSLDADYQQILAQITTLMSALSADDRSVTESDQSS